MPTYGVHGGLMGRPPEFTSVSDFEAKAAGFDDWIDEHEYSRILERFCQYLGITRKTFFEYRKKDGMQEDGTYDESQDYSNAFKKYEADFNAELIDKGMTGGAHPIFSMFLAKANYGYQDKVEVEVDGTINIKMAQLEEYSS